MSDETPVPPVTPAKIKISGLGPKAQKLQALREKAAGKAAPKSHSTNSNFAFKGKDAFAGTKKSSFQRKAT
jgi:hypothetical protein